MNVERLLAHFDRVVDGPDAIPRLRRLVLDLAVRGKLVEQDSADEPASELLKRIAVARAKVTRATQRWSSSLEAGVIDGHLFDLPTGWEWVSIATVFLYDAGIKRAPEALDPSLWLLELRDIEKDTGRLISKTRSAERASKSTKSEFQIGDILYGKLRPYLNKVLVADEPGYSTTEIVAIRSYVPLCSEYCALALRRPDFVKYVTLLGQGTKMPRLRTRDANVAPFPLPPLAEQHRIATKVDEIMALCDRLEEARVAQEDIRDRLTKASYIQLGECNVDEVTFRSHARFAIDAIPALTARTDQVKRLRQTIRNLAVRGKLVGQNSLDEPASALLNRIATERDRIVDKRILRRQKPLASIRTDEPPFEIPSGWEWSRIGDAVLFTQYGTSSRSSFSKSGVPVLTMGNIQDGIVICRNEKRIPDTAAELPALYLKQYDLLYNRTNSAELVGKTGIYLGEDDRRTFASYLIRIRVSLKYFSPHFLNLAMNTTEFRKTQIVPLIKKQTGQANVNGTALRSMLIPVPPLPEQHRIVTKVNELMILCDRLQSGLVTASTARRRFLDIDLQKLLSLAA